jgi:hypothetical protein
MAQEMGNEKLIAYTGQIYALGNLSEVYSAMNKIDSGISFLNSLCCFLPYSVDSRALIQSVQIIFEPNDGILNQLRNSGELHYFKNPELQAAA